MLVTSTGLQNGSVTSCFQTLYHFHGCLRRTKVDDFYIVTSIFIPIKVIQVMVQEQNSKIDSLPFCNILSNVSDIR